MFLSVFQAQRKAFCTYAASGAFLAVLRYQQTCLQSRQCAIPAGNSITNFTKLGNDHYNASSINISWPRINTNFS